MVMYRLEMSDSTRPNGTLVAMFYTREEADAVLAGLRNRTRCASVRFRVVECEVEF